MRVGDNESNLPAGLTAADALEQQKPQAAAREPRHQPQEMSLPARSPGAARGASFGRTAGDAKHKPGDKAPAHLAGGAAAADTIVWPQLQPAPDRPAVLGFYPHRDDESNGSGGVRRLIRRGVQFDEAHATSGEGGKRIVTDRRTGTISQQDPEDPAALARERGNESRRFLRMLGAGRRSTITSMHGNPDLDPFAPGARQDTAHLLDHEHGVWSTLQTKQQLINLLAERRPVAVLTMTHDSAVHQAHRAMYELVEETVGEFAAHYGIAAPGVFGVRETGWATDDQLASIDPARAVRVDLSRSEQRAKVRALVQSFASQPPGHPFRSEDARLNPLHRFDVYLDSASTLAEQGTRSERNDNVHGWDFLRPEEYFIASDATGPAQIEALRALFGRKVSIRKVIRQALASRLPLPGPRRRTVALTPPRDNEEEN
jgi:LmbE family N-acetylglucosaminyl deacetylase